MKKSVVVSQETANKFAVSVIASTKEAGYQVSWGAVNDEWDIFISHNNVILGRIQILPRNDGSVIDIDTEFMDEDEKEKYRDEREKFLTVLRQHLSMLL
jgi:hypothetical protein